jgi:hypothetical protein
MPLLLAGLLQAAAAAAAAGDSLQHQHQPQHIVFVAVLH